MLAGRLPADDCQQIDTTALPVKHPSRVRGPDGWIGPNGLHARFGRDAAHAEWFNGFRLAVKTDLGSRMVRAWSIVPVAVNEREAGIDLTHAGPPPRDLLCDKGFNGAAFAAEPADRGTAVLVPPTKTARARMPASLQKSSLSGATASRPPSTRSPTEWNSPDTAPTQSGDYSPTAATIAAHTLLRACLAEITTA
jgi:hypothetical protein